jgi:hypothetical protein
MAYTMELAACSEPNSGPKKETCESEHRRFEGGGYLLTGRAPCHLRKKESRFLYSRLFRKPTTSSHSQGSKSCQHAKTLECWGPSCGGKASHAQGHSQQHIYSENTFVLHVPLSVTGRVRRQAVTCQVQLFDILIDRRVCHLLIPSTTEAPHHIHKPLCALKLSFTPISILTTQTYPGFLTYRPSQGLLIHSLIW